MIKNRGWSPEDTAALNRYTEDDYYHWMSVSTNEWLLSQLKFALETFHPGIKDHPEYSEIGAKLVGALKRFWMKNKFYRYQILTHVAGLERLAGWGFEMSKD